MNKIWTKQEEEFLRENINRYDNFELAEKLGRPLGAIKSKISNMHIRRTDPDYRHKVRARRVTIIKGGKLTYLKKNIDVLTMDELIIKLEASESTIRSAMRKHGIKLSARVYRERVAKSRFKKGHVPQNKGKKMPAEIRERVKHTFFQKGNLPHNTKSDGYISIRPHKRSGVSYKWIRVDEGNWQLYHRHVWEQKHGGIPDGYIVCFKNSDTLDCRLQNLFCISQADNARRNWNREKAAASMRKMWASGQMLQNDKYVAQLISRKDKNLREKLLKNPQILDLKREQLKLRRAINESKKQD